MGTEGRCQHAPVAESSGHGHRLGAQLLPALDRGEERQRQRQPGQHPGPQRGVVVGQGGQRLLEQVDLVTVEQLDLEAAQAGAEPEGGGGEQLGTGRPAGEIGGGVEAGPGPGHVAGSQPRASPASRSSSPLVVSSGPCSSAVS